MAKFRCWRTADLCRMKVMRRYNYGNAVEGRRRIMYRVERCVLPAEDANPFRSATQRRGIMQLHGRSGAVAPVCRNRDRGDSRSRRILRPCSFARSWSCGCSGCDEANWSLHPCPARDDAKQKCTRLMNI